MTQAPPLRHGHGIVVTEVEMYVVVVDWSLELDDMLLVEEPSVDSVVTN